MSPTRFKAGEGFYKQFKEGANLNGKWVCTDPEVEITVGDH